MSVLAVLTWAYHLTSRLAYVIWVGVALSRQRRRQDLGDENGTATGFELFRRTASRLMANDAASFVLLCLVTRHSLPAGVPRGIVWGVSGLLIILGVGTKVWAASTLGGKAYYWHNFFVRTAYAPLDPPGPYRFLKNPMYTVGYLQMYGLALASGSIPALVAALFDQFAILMFHNRVEKPHYQAQLLAAAAPRLAAASTTPPAVPGAATTER